MKWVLIMILLCSSVFGATLSGTIYDSSLNRVSKAIVEINDPLQRDVIDNGTYFFELTPGIYNLSVYLNEGSREQSSNEIVLIEGEQNYVLDLFLFEDLSDEEGLVAPEIILEEPTSSSISTILIFGFLVLIGLLMYIMKPDKTEVIALDDDILKAKIIKIIKDNKRISQKDLRKEVPFSEAKVSIVIAELESEGKITKIKKGRCNLLIIKN